MVINISKKLLCFFTLQILIFFNTVLYAQKKYVTENEYELWTSMSAPNLSHDGNWATYQITNTLIKGMSQPKSPRDTLELTEFKTQKHYFFPSGYKAQFSKNSQWLIFLQKNQLVAFDLKKQKEHRYDHINNYDLALDDKLTLTLVKLKDKTNVLRILQNDIQVFKDIPEVESYVLSPDKNSMILEQKKGELNSLSLFNLNDLESPRTLLEKVNNCSQFTWSDSSNKFAFYQENTSSNGSKNHYSLHYMDLLDPSKNSVLSQIDIDSTYYLTPGAITFNLQEDKINFTLSPKDNIPKVIDPLIWKSSDPVQPPTDVIYPKNILAIWKLPNKHIKYFTNQDQIIASGDLNNFFTLNNEKYLPQFKYDNKYCDIIFYNSNTMEHKIIQEKFVEESREDVLAVSPLGKYFAWLIGNDWWIYDIKKGQKYCLTCNTKDDFSIDFDVNNTIDQPYSFAVFTLNDENIILTAKNNIYKYNFETAKIEKLIPLTDNKMTYKTEVNRFRSSLGTAYITYKKDPIDLSKGFFIKGTNLETTQESLYFYQPDKKLELITKSNNRISSPKKSQNTVTYTLSNFDLPYQIIYWKNGKTKLVKQSNKQQENYYWGHSELLTYPGPNNTTLQGALFYPGNYDPSKKYPIIFEVYTEGSIYVKSYQPVTLENSVAFNTSLLTTKDYFVFRPDIKYEMNYTGKSALQCVLAGVNAVSEIPGVDTKRMGLFGQSFGGFEANYIATQTDKFKAIISSAGWSDLVDAYLTIDDNRRFNYFRFEISQIRIKAPYYSQTFLDNSPILQANKITSPMLLIAGTSDRRVYWENSMKLQLALTRLGKESTLLLYKNEDHVMTQNHNQIDLNKKVIEWWDYHLKEKSRPLWN